MRLYLFRSREERVRMKARTPRREEYGGGGVNPKSVPPVVVVHPRLVSPARLAAPAVGNHFFLKNPNFGFGFAGAAASAAIHSYNTPASHVI